MRAYKFRSSSQVEFTFDILFNHRLFCSDWSNLNDPMEGMFAYSHDSTGERDMAKLVDEVVLHKRKIKVCSLAKNYDNYLLWSHYASGFSGFAIEVELPDDDDKIVEVEYGGVFAYISHDVTDGPSELAKRVLRNKTREWSYEKEVRVLNDQPWFKLDEPVSRVIVGHRMNPSLFQAMKIICRERGIELNRTGIGDEGIDADYVKL